MLQSSFDVVLGVVLRASCILFSSLTLPFLSSLVSMFILSANVGHCSTDERRLQLCCDGRRPFLRDIAFPELLHLISLPIHSSISTPSFPSTCLFPSVLFFLVFFFSIRLYGTANITIQILMLPLLCRSFPDADASPKSAGRNAKRAVLL